MSQRNRIHDRTRGGALVLLLAAAGLGAPGAAAQTAGVPSQPQPVRPNLPGPVTEEVGLVAEPGLVREGSFIPSARGQAVRGKSGRWFFVFDPDAGGHTLPPMVLMPNLNLPALERAAERNPAGTRLSVTGQVTVYQGLNYLLLGAPPLMVRGDEGASGGADAAGATPAAATTGAGAEGSKPAAADRPKQTPAPAAGPGAEPSIEDIAARLDKAASRVAATSTQRAGAGAGDGSAGGGEPGGAGGAGGGGDASSRPLMASGLIASRRGRVMRGSDGAMVFALDSGSRDTVVAPLVLLPCQNLSAIEQVAERGGEALTYTVTGEVTAYRGRNYLLLRSYQVNRVTDQVLPVQ